jgi:hypothetical protein
MSILPHLCDGRETCRTKKREKRVKWINDFQENADS